MVGGRQQADTAQRLGPVEDPLDVVDVQPHPLVLVGRQRSGLSPHRSRHAETSDVVDERGAVGQTGVGCGHLHQLGGATDQVGRGAGVAGEEGAPKVAEVADRLERLVELVVGQRASFDRLGGEKLVDGVPVEVLEQRLGIRRHELGDLGVEVGAAARADDVERRFDAGRPLEHLAGFGHVRDAGRQRHAGAGQVVGEPSTVPSGVGLLDAGPHVVAQPQAGGERAGRRAVVRHLLDHLATPAGHERRRPGGPG